MKKLIVVLMMLGCLTVFSCNTSTPTLNLETIEGIKTVEGFKDCFVSYHPRSNEWYVSIEFTSRCGDIELESTKATIEEAISEVLKCYKCLEEGK